MVNVVLSIRITQGTVFGGMQVGAGVDADSAAMDYGKKFLDKPIMGCGVVIKGMPIAIKKDLYRGV